MELKEYRGSAWLKILPTPLTTHTHTEPSMPLVRTRLAPATRVVLSSLRSAPQRMYLSQQHDPPRPPLWRAVDMRQSMQLSATALMRLSLRLCPMPIRDELALYARRVLEELLRLEIKERRGRPPIWQSEVLLTQLVEEGHRTPLQRLQARVGSVAQELGDELDGLRWRARPENLAPRVRLHLRELVLGVVLVHGLDLLQRRRSENLDNLDELVHPRFARKQRHP
mmetsp:Transcript_53225/g.122301  ORF Transcript_53225/g.122301 Transcript_53225/m.122301 type:complete len:225 (+) Transcript_53225:362-1036(+)